ncbi:hypothetical protein AV521_27820 [Streptomyces sp. IMTB 2501]|uniref:hypothetical protein n=1 Tax=Streptomyces sp. IMTB 2501 TaxID=1776340 RepID=UPI00096E00A5|nr:hypothetical protein [Streptomyces sp. IMTB 2501]OLZ66330.1 hypothetical protein AV521_27820 [Streptomyces sp. IMTB 2501]
MHAKQLRVLLATPVAAAALLLPLSANAQALVAQSVSAVAVAQPDSPRVTPYDQGYKDGYRDGLTYARDCIRGDSRGRNGKPGASAEYNRGYVAGIIAAYRYGHRTYCGFGRS